MGLSIHLWVSWDSSQGPVLEEMSESVSWVEGRSIVTHLHWGFSAASLACRGRELWGEEGEKGLARGGMVGRPRGRVSCRLRAPCQGPQDTEAPTKMF